MIELLVVVVLILAVFALVGAIWGKDAAQGCFGLFASCGVQALGAAAIGLILGLIAVGIFMVSRGGR